MPRRRLLRSSEGKGGFAPSPFFLFQPPAMRSLSVRHVRRTDICRCTFPPLNGVKRQKEGKGKRKERTPNMHTCQPTLKGGSHVCTAKCIEPFLPLPFLFPLLAFRLRSGGGGIHNRSPFPLSRAPGAAAGSYMSGDICGVPFSLTHEYARKGCCCARG